MAFYGFISYIYKMNIFYCIGLFGWLALCSLPIFALENKDTEAIKNQCIEQFKAEIESISEKCQIDSFILHTVVHQNTVCQKKICHITMTAKTQLTFTTHLHCHVSEANEATLKRVKIDYPFMRPCIHIPNSDAS